LTRTTKRLRPEERWRHGIKLPVTATDFKEYIEWKIKEYEKYEMTRDDLSMLYGQDFGNFTAETFEQVKQILQTQLRKFLRKYGVYVNKSRNSRISDALVEATKEELP
jgi:hypothetical protein